MPNRPDPRHVVTNEPSLSIEAEMSIGHIHIYLVYGWGREPDGLPPWRVTIASADNAEQIDTSPYLRSRGAAVELMHKAWVDLSAMLLAPDIAREITTIDYLKNLMERDDGMERAETQHPGACDRGA